MSQTERIPVSCNRDCLTGCPLIAEVRDGRVLRITDNPMKSRHMTGCPRGFLYHKVLYHPERITRPMIRTGERGEGKFRSADWNEALDLVTENLERITGTYGRESLMLLGGSGACRGALHNTSLVPRRFFSLYGGYTDTTGNFSSQATEFVKPYMYGTKYTGIDIKTLFHSKMVVLWGFNAADTRFGAETESVLRELKRRGTPIIVIDPRRSRTVRIFATQWLPVFPGSDSALILAVLHVILKRGLENREYIDTYSTGFAELERHILGLDGTAAKTPEWAAPLCGLPAEKIEDFACSYAAARPAALLQGLSVQRTMGGEEADRLGGVLQLVLGNVGVPGGSAGCGQWNNLPRPRFAALPVPENPAGSEVPVYQWADAAIEGKQAGWPADIRVLYNVGGNYIIQGSDVRRNIRAFEQAGFIVTHDYFMTDTARYSDIVLPATTFLERSDLIRTGMNYLFLSKKAIEPVGEARDDWEIFSELAERLGFGNEFTEGRTAEEWLTYLLGKSEPGTDPEFLRTGIYAGRDQERIGLSDFVGDPSRNPLATPSGRIEIAVPEFETMGGSRLPTWREFPQPEGYPLYLVTPHERLRNNSQFSNISEFRSGIDETIWIHPDDAERRGITAGDMVTVSSPQGKIRLAARVTDDIMPGVVSCSQGRWMSISSVSPDTGMTSVNVLTSNAPTLPSRGSRTHSVKVEICAADPSRTV